MTRISAEEYRQMAGKSTPKSKHHNNKVYVYSDGSVSIGRKAEAHGEPVEVYDSHKEYLRYRELILLQRGGRIGNLRRQVPMEIQQGYADSDGKLVKPIYYNADFCYIENYRGRPIEVVEDVKALDKASGQFLTTEAFRIKWKLLKAKYPDKLFRLV